MPTTINRRYGIKLHGPSRAHPFGTDAIGRDILARTIYGGQISLLIGLAAVSVALVVGVTMGALSGYYGGWIDGILMRFTEAMLNIPQLFLLIVAAKYLGDKVHNFQAVRARVQRQRHRHHRHHRAG